MLCEVTTGNLADVFLLVLEHFVAVKSPTIRIGMLAGAVRQQYRWYGGLQLAYLELNVATLRPITLCASAKSVYSL